MKGLVNHISNYMKKNSSNILTILGSAGVILTAINAVQMTPKAMKVAEEDSRDTHDGNPYAYSPLEFVKSSWYCYIPTIFIGSATIGCIISANAINKRTQASLISAYSLVNSSFQEYKTKLKDIYGEEVHNTIVNEIVKEKCEEVYLYSNGLSESSLQFVTSDPEIKRTFYDSYSKRYFESSINKVIEAEYHLNRNYTMRGYSSLNEFYNFLGISDIECGDTVGWHIYDGELYWIDFNHTTTTLDDGMEICVIDYVFNPEIIPDDYY